MTNRKGFTLIELMIGTGLASAVIIGVGMLLVDSQRGWNKMYSSTYSDVVTEAQVARKRFDSVVRNASSQGILLAADSSWVEVYYYGDPNSTIVDRYARFFNYSGGNSGQLMIEYGIIEPKQILITESLCGDVSSCIFKTAGNSAQMVLTINDGTQSATVVTSAVTHN
jgi:Tfp pilus assembly protein PilW